jgi:HD superfamily phosphohydrolase
MELLDIISKKHPHDFPQRPLFHSMYLLATRLLNGKNQEKPRDNSRHTLREVYPGLVRDDYETIHYERLSDALRDIQKEDGSWRLEKKVPELETYPKESIKFVPNMNTVLTNRLRDILEHPLVARLKLVSQLGLISLVYPPADHSRYDHVLGAFTYASSYIRSLFYDPYNCLFRNLVDEKDIKAALLASIIHDLGQYPLAHDLQEVCSDIFDHTNLSFDLLSDQTQDNENRTLLDIIEDPNEGWGVDIGTLKKILGARSENLDIWGIDVVDFKADMLSALINGPIDADKADYITRDSTNCRIPYGKQLDIERLLIVLTTVRIPEHLQNPHKVTIGVYEKGRASASAFSLARYLLYASVYWEHASRIMKAMLQYGTVLALPSEVFHDSKEKIKQIHEQLLSFVKGLIPPFEEEQKEKAVAPSEETVPEKQAVEIEPSPDVLKTLMKTRSNLGEREETGWYPGISITDRLMLKWIKSFATDAKGFRGVRLINMLLQRRLYKRLYTIERVDLNNELLGKFDAMEWLNRLKFCEQLQDNIYQIIKLREKELDTVPLTSPDQRDMLFTNNLVILADIPDPKKYAESYRPLMYQQELQMKTYYGDDVTPIEEKNLSNAIESLMKSIAPVRILCHPDALQWIKASKIKHTDIRKIMEKALGIGK